MNSYEDYEEMFCQLLDEEGEIKICGVSFLRSEIIKEIDPIAYREAFMNYLDSIGVDTDDVGLGELTEEEFEASDCRKSN